MEGFCLTGVSYFLVFEGGVTLLDTVTGLSCLWGVDLGLVEERYVTTAVDGFAEDYFGVSFSFFAGMITLEGLCGFLEETTVFDRRLYLPALSISTSFLLDLKAGTLGAAGLSCYLLDSAVRGAARERLRFFP